MNRVMDTAQARARRAGEERQAAAELAQEAARQAALEAYDAKVRELREICDELRQRGVGLREDLAAADARVIEHEREAGVRTLDAGDHKPAAKRAVTAREDVIRLRRALEAVDVRLVEADRRHVEYRESASRRKVYEWVAEYWTRAETVIAARAALASAEADLGKLGTQARIHRNHMRQVLPGEDDLDAEVIAGVSRFGYSELPSALSTVEGARVLRARAEAAIAAELAQAEEAAA